MSPQKKVLIIGGGASGIFAAIHHQSQHPNDQVLVIEKGKKCLQKVKISGGGRCNVTHNCKDPKQLCEYYPRGQKELLGPFHQWGPEQTMQWFDDHGVPLKTEADGRVFPVSNQSQSIINCLLQKAHSLGITIQKGTQVLDIKKIGPQFHIQLNDNHTLRADKLILATGSNPATMTWCKTLGHTIVPPVPSLFSFKINDHALCQLSGLSVLATQIQLNGQAHPDIRPLLITHWGLSGPAIIVLSSLYAIPLHQAQYRAKIHINWLAHYEQDDILKQLKEQAQKSPKKQLKSQSPFPELPLRLWSYLCQKSGVSSKLTWHQQSQKSIQRLAQTLQHCPLQVNGRGTFKDEFVTCGGVSLKEIDFKRMESKLCKGLYIVGELLNIDAVTGGFNFQNAWTTGYIAGQQSA